MTACALVSTACELDVEPRLQGVSAARGDGDAGWGALEAGTVVDRRDAASAKKPETSDAAASVDGGDAAAAGSSDTDEADAAVPETSQCAQYERVVPCGLNGRGEQPQICIQGEFREDGPCSDPDACTDEATREVACGANGNGTQAQRCDAGQWHQEGACSDVDVCVNDETRTVPCGLNGNGMQPQRCTAGMWQESGACSDPDVCVDAETRIGTCGPNAAGMRPQRCISGQWQNDGDCADGDVCMNGEARALPCGVLGGGARPQLCMSGQWQDDGACNDPDWTCSVADYGTGNDCNCACGSRDPDCDLDRHVVLNCADDQFCNTQGACEAIPDAWLCLGSVYGTRDGCDCDCGAYDPDCALPGQTLFGCSEGETCNDAGTCSAE